MARILKLDGEKFGRLSVIRKTGKDANGNYFWECICECGNIISVRATCLKSGHTKSCGCLIPEISKKVNIKHGYSTNRSPTYKAWNQLKRRCASPKDKRYSDYGQRGIKVCDSWLTSFSAFLSDMGDRPSSRHSIDRIDGNGDYEPSNCRWATSEVQNRNKRKPKNNTSGYKGVYWVEIRSIWRVMIFIDGKRVTVGWFEDLQEAVAARIEAELKYWGESYQTL